MTMTTLADVRDLMECHLPAECRERETWRHVAAAPCRPRWRCAWFCSFKQVPCLPQRRGPPCVKRHQGSGKPPETKAANNDMANATAVPIAM